MSIRSAMCVGINDYQGVASDLQGCVNDARDWARLFLETFHYDRVETIVNGEATRSNLLTALKRLVRTAAPDDVVAVTFSGHGTWEPDKAPLDEADGRDEAWCAVDGNLLDDTLRRALRQLRRGVRLAIVSDSCHSGTVTRSPRNGPSPAVQRWADRNATVRFKPPRPPGADAWRLPKRRSVFVPEASLPEVLLTGCAADEYAYDARIGGRYNGAFSWYAIELLQRNPQQSYRELLAEVRRRLPSDAYPQTP